jgi:hypothetical protein
MDQLGQNLCMHFSVLRVLQQPKVESVAFEQIGSLTWFLLSLPISLNLALQVSHTSTDGIQALPRPVGDETVSKSKGIPGAHATKFHWKIARGSQ